MLTGRDLQKDALFVEGEGVEERRYVTIQAAHWHGIFRGRDTRYIRGRDTRYIRGRDTQDQ